MVTSLGAASAAQATPPWPFDGQNAYSFRAAAAWNDAPAVSTSMKVGWARGFDSDVTGTPVVSDNGGVYVGTWSGDLYALLYNTGATAWAQGSARTGGPIIGSPLLANNSVYVATSNIGKPALVRLDPITGQVIWKTQVDSSKDSEAWASPTYSPSKNLIYVATCACRDERGNNTALSRGALIAVDANTGLIVWKQYTIPTGTGAGIWGTPVVIDFANLVYVTTGKQYSGTANPGANAVLAYDTGTGQLMASFTLPDGGLVSGGFRAPPIAFQDPTATQIRIGAGAQDGSFYALDYQTLAKVWSTTVGVGSAFGGPVSGTSWDIADKLILGTSAVPTIMWGINANNTDGSLAWAEPGSDGVHYGPTSFARTYMWTADSDGFLDIQDPRQAGRIVHRLPLLNTTTGLAPTTAGVSFGWQRAFIGIGTGLGTGGGIVAVTAS